MKDTIYYPYSEANNIMPYVKIKINVKGRRVLFYETVIVNREIEEMRDEGLTAFGSRSKKYLSEQKSKQYKSNKRRELTESHEWELVKRFDKVDIYPMYENNDPESRLENIFFKDNDIIYSMNLEYDPGNDILFPILEFSYLPFPLQPLKALQFNSFNYLICDHSFIVIPKTTVDHDTSWDRIYIGSIKQLKTVLNYPFSKDNIELFFENPIIHETIFSPNIKLFDAFAELDMIQPGHIRDDDEENNFINNEFDDEEILNIDVN